MEITSPNTTSRLTNEDVELRCVRALAFRDKGDFDAAQNAMRGLWRGVGYSPEIEGLHPNVAAEVLLCAGILTGWIGSRNEIKEADDYARDLISESIARFEALKDSRKVAEARTELAYCYWREGSFDEARIMFTDALQRLTTGGRTRANALLGLAVVERSSSRLVEAEKILTDNATLFKRLAHPTLKGFYHNTLAGILQGQITPEKDPDLLVRIVKEYVEADRQFTVARNTLFRAMVKNNLGNILIKLDRFREAQRYLDHARRLAKSLGDRVRTAQVDQTRAEGMIAQGRYQDADKVARMAARSFEKAGRQCFLVEALTVRGIALARQGRREQAQFTLQKAIEVAQQVNVLSLAGVAALTLIEELDALAIETLAVAYERANEWLAESQSPDLLRRVNTAASKLLARLQVELITARAPDALSNEPLNLTQELLKTERALIRRALAQVNGSVTRAAVNLSMTYQRLAYILETRHRDLLKERTPIRRRSQKRNN